MNGLKVGDVCVMHSLMRRPEYNGAVVTIIRLFKLGGENFAVLDIKHPDWPQGEGANTRLSNLKKIEPSGDNESVQEIWNDLIHRLTEGVPV